MVRSKPLARNGVIPHLASPSAALAIMVAIVLPVALALIYPTYTYTVYPQWFEWTRLHELPFVFFEGLVIVFALRRGLELAPAWVGLPKDVRIATLVLLTGAFIGSALYSKHPDISITGTCIQIIHLAFAVAVFHLLVHEKRRDLAALLPMFAASIAILAVYTAIWFAIAPDPSMVPGGVIWWPNAIPGFISVRHFGSWSGAIAAGFAIAILYGKDTDRLGWNHAFYTLSAAVTVWTGTRAAVLAMVVVAVIAVATLRRLPPARAIGRAAALTGLALVLAWLVLPKDPTFRLIVLDEYGSVGQATAGRNELWSQAFNRWLASPWFGWGTDSTFWETYIGWTHTQPHNVVLQFLISWGIVGAAGGLYLIGRAIFAVHGPSFADDELRPLVAILYGLLFQSLLEGMLHYPRFIGTIVFLFALLIVNRRPLQPS